MRSRFDHPLYRLGWVAFAIEASLLALHFARRDDEQILFMMGAYLVCGVAWGWAILRGWRGRAGEAGNAHPTIIAVFIIGLLFRATLMPLDSAASQDVRRYLWEGLVQQAGYSPYELAPDDPALATLAEKHADLHQRVNHPDLAAIYPAFAQLLFRANAALFGGSLLGWKLILLAFDLLLAGTLYAYLRKDRAAALLGLIGVWWCPLLLLETYEGGHLDLIGAALLTLAVVAMLRGRWLPAGVALGLAVNVKYIWPIIGGIWLLQAAGTWRQRLGFALVASVTAAACWLPYWRDISAAIATARHFAEHWTFNDPLFEVIRTIPGPRWLPMLLVMTVLCGLAVWLARRPLHAERGRDATRHRDPERERDPWLLNGTALLLGPVAYPWYFLWIVPGLALRPRAWLIVWVLCVPALHLVDWQYVRSGRWAAMPWLWVLVDVIPACLLIRAWISRLRDSCPRAGG